MTLLNLENIAIENVSDEETYFKLFSMAKNLYSKNQFHDVITICTYILSNLTILDKHTLETLNLLGASYQCLYGYNK